MNLVLDTHTFVWIVQYPELVSPSARQVIQGDAIESISISSISLWEVAMLHEKNRLKLEVPIKAWFERAVSLPKFRIAELTSEIAIESVSLPGGFHGDPSDRIIVATARIENSVLITKDRQIRGYKHVKTLW